MLDDLINKLKRLQIQNSLAPKAKNTIILSAYISLLVATEFVKNIIAEKTELACDAFHCVHYPEPVIPSSMIRELRENDCIVNNFKPFWVADRAEETIHADKPKTSFVEALVEQF